MAHKYEVFTHSGSALAGVRVFISSFPAFRGYVAVAILHPNHFAKDLTQLSRDIQSYELDQCICDGEDAAIKWVETWLSARLQLSNVILHKLASSF